MAKRANGEGTIRKRSDGRWEGRYYDPATGKQKSIYRKTQKEVREELSRIAVDKDVGRFATDTDMTLDEWFEYYIRNSNKRNRHKRQQEATQKKFIPGNHANSCTQTRPQHKCSGLAAKYSIDDYIFTNYKNGDIMCAGQAERIINSVAHYLKTRYNIEVGHITPHSFRHTFISRGMRNGIFIETLKELVGHADYSMISRIYAYASDNDKSRAVSAIAGQQLGSNCGQNDDCDDQFNINKL